MQTAPSFCRERRVEGGVLVLDPQFLLTCQTLAPGWAFPPGELYGGQFRGPRPRAPLSSACQLSRRPARTPPGPDRRRLTGADCPRAGACALVGRGRHRAYIHCVRVEICHLAASLLFGPQTERRDRPIKEAPAGGAGCARHRAAAAAAWALPAAGRDRRAARAGADCGADRLAADRGALRSPRPDRAVAGGRARLARPGLLPRRQKVCHCRSDAGPSTAEQPPTPHLRPRPVASWSRPRVRAPSSRSSHAR
jgi:hypothetical protein